MIPVPTHFAPARRASPAQLRHKIEQIASNPVIDGLLGATSGLLAVLNEHRQILAVNETLLKWLGVGAAGDVLGLRPGEAIKCIHAHEMPGGCGTSQYCGTCGAAIAIVSAVADDLPMQRTCSVTVERDGLFADIYLRVQCCPMRFSGRRILLLFLQDITREQQAAAIERAFFHDVSNVATALTYISDCLRRDPGRKTDERATQLHRLSLRLASEIKFHRCLVDPENYVYQKTIEEVTLRRIVGEIRSMFDARFASEEKRLVLPKRLPAMKLRTDVTLVLRILNNMVLNALEASAAGDEVRLWIEPSGPDISFCVWNRQAIPPDVARRVFQRNFSTKQQIGRGIGTYSMKLLGEQFLSGAVRFTTSPQDGTVFRLTLPMNKR